MNLYGKAWTRRELEARVGRLEQIGGVRRLQWTEGAESGSEQAQVRTGAGLAYYVGLSKGLDISLAEFGGTPISWQAPNGDVHPAYYDAEGAEWLRTATGGLLMTCGLTQAGSPNVDVGQRQGLHGRAHHLPARHVAAHGRWTGDDYETIVSGVIEEATVAGDFLRLTRQIVSRLGDNRIVIRDTVENAGFRTSPHMMLYHFNFGFPLMDDDTRIESPHTTSVAPREAGTLTDGWERWQRPDASYTERVYYHDVKPGPDGRAEVRLFNPRFPYAGGAGTGPIRVRLSWNTDRLPRLVQWKMPAAGTHVLGIEPANCRVGGRADERRDGTLVFLEPGEQAKYELELEVSGAAEEMR
ncbi:DUF4432 domain-containing protein [Paenibacillus flagellatus]|uniref:DUF4432 domain-containing protein n=2 Tax=Paenibacillus flagellatus TaxID=2211139 RepID=A0A2V5K8R1_9BACL|nr:DUF4432 domain-containing protein [Paenibacillus flagellatus]